MVLRLVNSKAYLHLFEAQNPSREPPLLAPLFESMPFQITGGQRQRGQNSSR